MRGYFRDETHSGVGTRVRVGVYVIKNAEHVQLAAGIRRRGVRKEREFEFHRAWSSFMMELLQEKFDSIGQIPATLREARSGKAAFPGKRRSGAHEHRPFDC